MRQPFPYPGDDAIGHCPLTLFRDLGPEFENKVLTYHMSWKQGVLPETGGLLDQGAAYPDAMASVEAGFNAAQELKREQAQREQEKKLRAGKTGGRKTAR